MDYKNIETSTLPNGLKVITDYLPGMKECSVLDIIVHTGGAHDPDGQNGLAHFAEHLAMHGSPNIGGDELRKTWGANVKFYNSSDNIYNNMITGPFMTNYRLSGLSDAVFKVCEEISKSITHCAYTIENVELEKGRIINEMKADLGNSNRQASWYYAQACYGDNRLGRWLNGLPDDLQSINHQHIRAYHERVYVGNNMSVLYAGDKTHDEIVEWADSNFAHLPMGERQEIPERFHSNKTIFDCSQYAQDTEFQVFFPIFRPIDPRETYAISGFLNAIIKKTIDYADENKLYNVSFSRRTYDSADYHDFVLATSVSPADVMHFIPSLIGFIENSISSIVYRQWVKEIQDMQMRDQLNNKWTQQSMMKLNDTFVSFNSDAFEKRRLFECQQGYEANEQDFESTKNVILSTLRNVMPGVLYKGAIPENAPTGDMIQRRDFSGSSSARLMKKGTAFTPS